LKRKEIAQSQSSSRRDPPEVSSPLTVLFFYADGFYLMDSASYRRVTQKPAQLTRAPCLSVGYRLTPQNPFPTALFDWLVYYFKVLNLPFPATPRPPPPPQARSRRLLTPHIILNAIAHQGKLPLIRLKTLLELQHVMRRTWEGGKGENEGKGERDRHDVSPDRANR